jgi:protoheme IX farnesyltransferase
MIGWACVTNSVTIESTVLFLIIFLWTPAHFWALALFKMRDYDAVGVPMLPNVAGDAATRTQILVYSILLAPIGLLPFLFGETGPLYGAAALLLGAEFVRRAFLLWRRGGADRNAAAKRLFGFSLLYLFGLFAVRLVELGLPGFLGG